MTIAHSDTSGASQLEFVAVSRRMAAPFFEPAFILTFFWLSEPSILMLLPSVVHLYVMPDSFAPSGHVVALIWTDSPGLVRFITSDGKTDVTGMCSTEL